MAGEGDRGRGGRRRRAGVVDRREYDRDDEADEGGGDGDGDGSGHAVGVVCVMLFDDGHTLQLQDFKLTSVVLIPLKCVVHDVGGWDRQTRTEKVGKKSYLRTEY